MPLAPPALLEITVHAPAAAADAVSALLWATGAQGIAEGELGDAATHTIWLAADHDLGPLRAALTAAVPAARLTARPVCNHWGQPAVTPIGRAWAIGPPGAEPPADRQLIALTPGLGFGSDGTHPTTRLAFAALETALDALPQGARVLDVGTGAGILALLAARRGARAWATDHDSSALAAARANAAANGLEIQLSAELPAGPFDLIVANLPAPTLLALTPALLPRLAPGGQSLCAGLRVAHRATLCALAAPLELTAEAEEAGWLGLSFRQSLSPG